MTGLPPSRPAAMLDAMERQVLNRVAEPQIRPSREVRALLDETTVVVYQAYRREIAQAALRAGTFVPPFSLNRMTWIKPSFLWMAHRSGIAQKEGQEHVLAVRITREGFDWALAHASLSAFEAQTHDTREAWETQRDQSPVRVQWDPERDVALRELPYRAIQIGLGVPVVPAYVREWIVGIQDATETMRSVAELVLRGDTEAARTLLPTEMPYLVEPTTALRLGMTATG
jgi:hypothetical protein